jgi:LysM repeat protein
MMPVMSLEALVSEHRLRNNIHLQSSAFTNFNYVALFIYCAISPFLIFTPIISAQDIFKLHSEYIIVIHEGVIPMLYPNLKQSSAITMEKSSPCLENNFYEMQEGDTFYKISKLYNISLDDLIEANHYIDPDLIHPGQIVNIPLTASKANCPIGATTYIVQKGDTFYSIAKKFKMRLSELLKANPYVNPDALLIGQSLCLPMISSSYINETYRIKFIYPYLWSKIDNERYAGIDGFFQVSAISRDVALEEVCSHEAHHKLKPYGTQPAIIKAEVDGHKACFIIPSADQPMEMRNQSALIAVYDKPIDINGTSCKYLIVWTEKNHLKDISDTLVFL